MIGQSTDNSFAYLLGVYLGDGSVAENHCYSQGIIDKDFADAVRQAFAYLGAETTLTYRGERRV
jgi:hypothetical protein